MALDLTQQSSLQALGNHAYCELGGEAVVLNLDSGIYYGLDMVGTSIWRMLQKPRSLPELRDLVVDEFDVASERCEADLRPFLASLRLHGLLLVGDAIDQ